MATITERKLASGSSTYRVQFRRAGLPYISRTFNELSEAEDFSKLEEDFIFNSTKYVLKHEDYLIRARKNEFKR